MEEAKKNYCTADGMCECPDDVSETTCRFFFNQIGQPLCNYHAYNFDRCLSDVARAATKIKDGQQQ